jgi:surface antigen
MFSARRTIGLAAAVLGLPLGCVMATAPQALAASTGGYPYANATACGTHAWCINGSEISPYGYEYRNCTDYVAWKIQQVFDVTLPKKLGDADTWGPRLRAHGYRYDSSPRVGDIAAWNTGGGGFGHVAYVYKVKNGIASLDEYNAANTGLFSSDRTTASNSAGAPSEFVHIGTVPTTTDRDGIGFYNPSNDSWHLRNSLSGTGSSNYSFVWGGAGDIPLVGDWNGA